MTDRSVIVRLAVASQDFENGMLRAGTSVRVLSSELDQNSESSAESSAGLQQLATVATAAGGAMTGAFVVAAKVFADFDQQMSNVGASADVSASEMNQLRDAAIEAGRATFFSATEAAEGEEALAKAGITAADIVGGALTGALNLAAAGGVDVAEAAETAASAMTIFGLSGSEVPHIADVLAAAAGKAQGSVHDMSMAMQQSALVADQTGLSLEDTAGALALFASNGLVGSDAGTSFKTMLQRLNPQSVEAAKLMDELGLRAYDSQGQFIGLAQYAGNLQTALSGMSAEQRNAALQTLFGSDAVRAAVGLYSAGAAGVQKWTTAVNDQGYASDQASKRMDNLNGDIEQFKGAVESAILGAGSGANDVLRAMTQHLTNMVNGFAMLPGPIQQSAVGIAGIGGTALLAVGAVSMITTRLSALSTTLAAGGASSQFFGKAVGGFGKALPFVALGLGVLGGVLDYFGRKNAEAKKQVDDFTQSINADSGAIDTNTRKLSAQKLVQDGVDKAAKQVGLSAGLLTDAVAGNSDALTTVAVTAKKATDEYNRLHAQVMKTAGGNRAATTDELDAAESRMIAANKVKGAVDEQRSAIDKAMDAYKRSTNAAGEGDLTQKTYAATVKSVADAMDKEADAADALKKALDGLNGKGLDVEESYASFLQSINGVTEGMHQQVNGQDVLVTSLEGADAASLANRQNIMRSIEAAQAYAQSVAKQTGSVQAGTAAYEANINTLFAQLEAAGLNKEQLDRLRQSVIDIPGLKQILIDAQTKNAQDALSELWKQISALTDSTKIVDVLIKITKTGTAADQAIANANLDAMMGVDLPPGTATGKASGGLITGPGTGTSDSVPIAASNGEYMIKAATVKKFGVGYFDALNGGQQVMTPVGAFAPQSTSSSSSNDQGALVSEVRDLRRSVDQLQQIIPAAAFGSTSRLADTLQRGYLAGSADVLQ